MSIRLTGCEVCPCRFKVRDLNKPFIGYVDSEPVYEHSYSCPSCKHKHVVRLYHSTTNIWHDKCMTSEIGLRINRYKIMEYQMALLEHEQAKMEFDKAMDRLKKELGID